MVQHRFIMIAFPAQGHINPALQLAKCLIRTTGAHVTFVTAVSALRRMANGSTTPSGLTFSPFSDGYDDGVKPEDDKQHVLNELKHGSSQAIVGLVHSGANEGRPYTCIVYTLLLSWVAEVATELHLPTALAWIQPATVFDIYYYYFNGYKDLIKNNTGADNNDPSFALELPGLPLLFKSRDLPSFILASSPIIHRLVIQMFEDQFEDLGKLSKPIILVNTFDALEPGALKAIDKYNLIGVGPLMPSAFLDDKNSSDKSFGCDIFQKAKESSYMEWLNSKPEQSVVYVSFGSISVLSKNQMEELAKGLLDCGRPFLWVIRENQKKGEGKEEKEEEEELSCRAELEELGMIVPWCSQVEVLSNPSLGCFVTHCGWNSTLESLVCGVPVVAFPQWSDQGTNAKLIEDSWKTGVRVERNEEGVVVGEEIKRCLDLVMESDKMRRNAKKWKDLAREAVSEGGSSHKNLKAFLEEIEERLR
ncbi:PREDICTED: crocetin glucosyltransferase, chloroplastic-like [Fragaria vesca subsp. vesca]|uniref:crocetin glucosyltransferase, chloroplastic-like n=1 Tax=Fragaria vesca subsp. vesca TaxID=101020 RepID=UPI0002C2E99B|nr:PREDICTED: crocetin glucosyltransferase, chloroplastic-like [Fragaria vesca subsp. vesca]